MVIRAPGEGQMPAFGLSDNDLNAIVAYIRAGFDPEGVAFALVIRLVGKLCSKEKESVLVVIVLMVWDQEPRLIYQRLVLFAHRLHYKEIYWILLRRYYQLTDQFGSNTG
ncbi:MAG: hypothetical protein CM1200mP40_03500 [Gammaproteobacteria bacterium]|nr:MAG: hypothetical protein CM1200mP40_03500 [Gammaproteobacteria bacterium]